MTRLTGVMLIVVCVLLGCAHQTKTVKTLRLEGFKPQMGYNINESVSLASLNVYATFLDGSEARLSIGDPAVQITGDITRDTFTLYTETEGRYHVTLQYGQVRYVLMYFVADSILVGVDQPYATLESALKDAEAGDTITMTEGSYALNTVIDASLEGITLLGNDNVVVYADNPSEAIVTIETDDVTIEGIHFIASFNAITVLGGDRLTVKNCQFENHDTALLITHGSEHTIKDNAFDANQTALTLTENTAALTFKTNTVFGLMHEGSGVIMRHNDESAISGHVISHNHFENLATGVRFETNGDYTSVQINSNTFKDNTRGIGVDAPFDTFTQTIEIRANIVIDNHIGVHAGIGWDLDISNNYWGGHKPEKLAHTDHYKEGESSDIMGTVIITHYYLDAAMNYSELMEGGM